jgi:hypothetical protein
MQIPFNGEEKARLVRGGESQSEYFLDSDIDRKSGSTGRAVGSQPLGVDRGNGSSRASIANRREETTGKIINHLISECRGQVAVKKNEIEHLELKIQEFEALLEDIEQSTEEQIE